MAHRHVFDVPAGQNLVHRLEWEHGTTDWSVFVHDDMTIELEVIAELRPICDGGEPIFVELHQHKQGTRFNGQFDPSEDKYVKAALKNHGDASATPEVEAVVFEFRNAYSWLRAKKVELILLQHGPDELLSKVDPLPELCPQDTLRRPDVGSVEHVPLRPELGLAGGTASSEAASFHMFLAAMVTALQDSAAPADDSGSDLDQSWLDHVRLRLSALQELCQQSPRQALTDGANGDAPPENGASLVAAPRQSVDVQRLGASELDARLRDELRRWEDPGPAFEAVQFLLDVLHQATDGAVVVLAPASSLETLEPQQLDAGQATSRLRALPWRSQDLADAMLELTSTSGAATLLCDPGQVWKAAVYFSCLPPPRKPWPSDGNTPRSSSKHLGDRGQQLEVEVGVDVAAEYGEEEDDDEDGFKILPGGVSDCSPSPTSPLAFIESDCSPKSVLGENANFGDALHESALQLVAALPQGVVLVRAACPELRLHALLSKDQGAVAYRLV